MIKALIVCSGGLDSVTLAHDAVYRGWEIDLISFDYGQRHSKELKFAALCADRLGARHWQLDMSILGKMISSSTLLGDGEIPDGHYAEESMKQTIVPNRNAIMLSIAFGVASGNGHDSVWTAVHGGDHFIYPDCRPEFIRSFEVMETLALLGLHDEPIALLTPYLRLSKAEIVKRASDIGVPLGLTWSCYKGGAVHCGACGTCFERREAFKIAGIEDPTSYLALPEYETPEIAR